ncbi:MAG: aminotransferase class V-fold PLP-dependent enzyme [Thermoanaerobaculales bacterium]|nr:aminotransferase class V-fold PLP-dependent enzyme [Thermoanaerobaculales bacterium]
MDIRLPPTGTEAHVWGLNPEIVFLNHGSFGACPLAVLEKQAELRRRMEAEPVRFFVRELQDLLDEARSELATFVGADPEGLAFVSNATTGVNTVLASLDFGPGDELLVTNHEYNACRNALNARAVRAEARVVEAVIPFPLKSNDAVIEAVLARVTPRTRLALVDHVTSQTGIVLPIAELTDELENRGIAVLIDGAHAPGMLDLKVDDLGASFYTGNCHKWLCAPKGAAFLWVRKDHRNRIHPLTISHGANAPLGRQSRFHLEFDWVGTDDPTAFLSVPTALRTVGALAEGGWPEVRVRNRALALYGRRILCEQLGIEPPCPDSMIGSLAAIPLPDGSPEPPTSPLYCDPLQDELLFRHGVEVPVIPWPAPPKRLLRISAQLYNSEEQYRYLAEALGSLIGA